MDIIVIILSHGLFRISAGLRCDRDLIIWARDFYHSHPSVSTNCQVCKDTIRSYCLWSTLDISILVLEVCFMWHTSSLLLLAASEECWMKISVHWTLSLLLLLRSVSKSCAHCKVNVDPFFVPVIVSYSCEVQLLVEFFFISRHSPISI
jgi:hypothetical protein